MTAIVVIIAIVALIGVAYFAIVTMNKNQPSGTSINVDLPTGNNSAQ
jgi:hypothetical protein